MLLRRLRTPVYSEERKSRRNRGEHRMVGMVTMAGTRSVRIKERERRRERRSE